MTETQPLAEVKAHLSTYIDRVESQHDRVLITRNGRPAAMLMSPDDLESLEVTVELLSDAEAMRELAEAEADVVAGRVVDADELRHRFR
jgi:antitoxin YefM